MTNSASIKTTEGVDSLKSTTAWEQTKDKGNEIIDAVKSGAEAGWKMVHGTPKD